MDINLENILFQCAQHKKKFIHSHQSPIDDVLKADI
jgi:hypothetical protein